MATWPVPSPRLMRDSAEPGTPPPALGRRFAVKGGHSPAQPPAHMLRGPVSLSDRYSVRPCPLTSRVPSGVWLVWMAAFSAAGAAAFVPAPVTVLPPQPA